jgi:hypothetical protein
MLKLFINDQAADITNDISITLKFASPIFNKIGDYTYPFKLPATPLNVSILGFKHRIETAFDPFEIFSGTLEWNGVIVAKGTIRILKAQAEFYEATLFMDKGDFLFLRKNMTLQDIDFGTMSFGSLPLKMDYFNAGQQTIYPERNFSLPQILNKSYYETLPDHEQLWYFNYYYFGDLQYRWDLVDNTPLVPMLYLRYVLKMVFEKIGFTLDDDFFAMDPQYNSMVLYNNVNANCRNEAPFDYDIDKVFLSYHVPHMTLNDFLSGLESFFNLRFFVNNLTGVVKLVSVDKIIKSSDTVDFSSMVSDIYTEIGDPLKGFKLSMNIDSDDDVASLQTATMDEMISNVKPSVESIADLPIWPNSPDNEIRFVRDTLTYFMLYNHVWVSIPTWTNFGGLNQFIHAENDISMETKFSTLFNAPGELLECIVGNSMANWAATTPKLFFVKFHPFVSGIENSQKVYGSNRTDSKYLFYSEDHGLYNQHFKAFLDFQMQAKTVKFIKQLTLLDLNQLDFSKKHTIDGNNYMLSTVQVTLTNQGFKPATITALTCF